MTGGRGDRRSTAVERARKVRWSAPGAARVVHPVRGSVVVPCASKFAAILCAAEVWGCGWAELGAAQVLAAPPGDRVEPMPHII